MTIDTKPQDIVDEPDRVPHKHVDALHHPQDIVFLVGETVYLDLKVRGEVKEFYGTIEEFIDSTTALIKVGHSYRRKNLSQIRRYSNAGRT